MRCKRNGFYLGRSGKDEDSKVGKRNDFNWHFSAS